jgi:acyl-CoA hydrolase
MHQRSMPSKLASHSFLEKVEYITASPSFHDNTAFGGQLFAWMDGAAAISVMKHSGTKAVTASVDALYFLKPVNIGYIVHVQTQIVAVYNSSCQVRAEVTANLPRSNDKTRIAIGYFTMVAVDELGKPQLMPKLEIATAEDRHLQRIAHELKDLRMTINDTIVNFG